MPLRSLLFVCPPGPLSSLHNEAVETRHWITPAAEKRESQRDMHAEEIRAVTEMRSKFIFATFWMHTTLPKCPVGRRISLPASRLTKKEVGIVVCSLFFTRSTGSPAALLKQSLAPRPLNQCTREWKLKQVMVSNISFVYISILELNNCNVALLPALQARTGHLNIFSVNFEIV